MTHFLAIHSEGKMVTTRVSEAGSTHDEGGHGWHELCKTVGAYEINAVPAHTLSKKPLSSLTLCTAQIDAIIN